MSTDTQLASKDTSVTPSTDAEYKSLYETSEKGRRNAQAQLTPVQQELSRLRAENAILREQPDTAVDNTEKARLDELKYSDPDAWRTEINKFEQSQDKSHADRVDAKYGEIISEMSDEQMVATTKRFFEGKSIDPAVVINAMPKGLQDLIDTGSITLEEGLQRGVDLVNGATIKSVLAPGTPKLSDVAGSSKPTNEAKAQQSNQDWGAMVL